MLAPLALRAQPAGPAPAPGVARIEVEGNRNVPAEQILNWFALRPGDRFDPARVSRAVKELTAKGRFSDVRVEGEEQAGGVVLFVVVQEYPYVQEVRLEGEDHIKEKDLRAAMKLQAGSFVSPAALRADVEKIAALYKDKGYFRAAVRDTLVALDGGKQALELHVAEGEKSSVQEIVFAGNQHVPGKTLRKQMETKRDGLLRGGELKMDQLQEDFDRVTAYYRNQGYLDAQVVGHELEVGSNGRDLTVRIQVQEGPRYTVGDVSWTGNTKFGDEEIRRRIRLKRNEAFSEASYDASTTALQELYNDAGYIYFRATPRRDVHDQVVDLTYAFEEGEAARVNHIRVVGNTKTQDKVILREFLVLPGDVFDRSKLMRSIREVFALGFFEDANIEHFTPRNDGSVDLELRVVEKQTGQLGAGAGYSAANALTGFFEVAETNLFGTGKRLSLRWEFSKRQNDIEFGFSQPWLFDTPTHLGVELYNSSRRTRINDFYREKRTGGALTVGRRLDFLDYTTARWRYRVESIRLQDFDFVSAGGDSLAQKRLRDLQGLYAGGPRRSFSTGLTLERNSTDNPFFPSSGSDAELSSDLFGTFLGGDESYLRSRLSLASFRSIAGSKLTLMLRSNFGLLLGLEGREVPNYERFRLGGNRNFGPYQGLRGYDDLEVVPAGNPAFLGGQATSVFTTELVYPFGPKVHGVLFFDAGNTWNSFREADPSLLRKGAGIGVRVEVPMLGQLGLDYGYGFDRVDRLGRDRDGWNLHFNFGSLF